MSSKQDWQLERKRFERLRREFVARDGNFQTLIEEHGTDHPDYVDPVIREDNLEEFNQELAVLLGANM